MAVGMVAEVVMVAAVEATPEVAEATWVEEGATWVVVAADLISVVAVLHTSAAATSARHLPAAFDRGVSAVESRTVAAERFIMRRRSGVLHQADARYQAR